MEFKTLYDSLGGKSFTSKHNTILKKAKDDPRKQKAVLGLIIYYFIQSGESPSLENLPPGIKALGEETEIDGDLIPVEVMEKINQLLEKKKK